jgi:hypothetical protein
MLLRFDSQLDFPSPHGRLLENLVIDQDGPGTILPDFQVLLAFLKEREPPASKANELLPLKVLPEINARLVRPLQLGLKRPQLKSYPHLQGLYLLARAAGLAIIKGTPKKPLVMVDGQVYHLWEKLNPTERYCTLLETWLLWGRSEIVGERGFGLGIIPGAFERWISFFHRIPDDGLAVVGNRDAESLLRYTPGWHNLGLMELFGLISVQHGLAEQGKGWRTERLDRTPLGDALLALLGTEFFRNWDVVSEFEASPSVRYSALRPVLQPYLTDWRNILAIPEQPFRGGVHIFKVALGRVWRRIAIPAEQTLDALSDSILGAYHFDSDHLHEFSYRNHFGVLERIHHSYMDEGPWTSEALIGDLSLRVGQTMVFHFDFGDDWRFDVTLEQVDPADESIQEPRVLDQHGKAPEQYASWG